MKKLVGDVTAVGNTSYEYSEKSGTKRAFLSGVPDFRPTLGHSGTPLRQADYNPGQLVYRRKISLAGTPP